MCVCVGGRCCNFKEISGIRPKSWIPKRSFMNLLSFMQHCASGLSVVIFCQVFLDSGSDGITCILQKQKPPPVHCAACTSFFENYKITKQLTHSTVVWLDNWELSISTWFLIITDWKKGMKCVCFVLESWLHEIILSISHHMYINKH